MAKASSGTVTAKSARSGSAKRLARKTVAAAKPAVAKPTARRSKPVAVKPTLAFRNTSASKAKANPKAPKKAASAKLTAMKAVAGKPKAGKAAAKMGAAKFATAKPAAAKPAAAKSGAAKTAASKRLTARPSLARRPPRPAASSKRAAAPARPVAARPPQDYAVSHLNQADFKADGLRNYAQYRDLGIAAATSGLCQAHVIRFIPPCTDAVRKRHRHATDLQLVYVLQGWMKNEFEGIGEQMMSTGSCWLQPSGIQHTVLDYSADCEVLEIIVPADFKTEELA